MTLKTDLDAITEAVRQQAPPDVFARMESATTQLAASGLGSHALNVGQSMPDFELPDATHTMRRSADLRSDGLLLITFYRGHWCPYCNVALQALQARLGEIESYGATLVAISPQTPDQSLTTQQKQELKFLVLSDLRNQVARQFGLVFTLDEQLLPIYQAFGIDLELHNGDRTFELPIPATYLIATDGTVLNAWFSVDYRERLDPETAIQWLQQATSQLTS